MASVRKTSLAYDFLLEYIEKNLFAINDKLPSENELALKLGLSRSTIRKALESLAAIGVVYKIKGAGTFIDKNHFIKLSTKSKILEGSAERDSDYKIALIVQGQDNDANLEFQSGVKSVLKNYKVNLKVYVTDNRFANERFCLENLMQSGFDGFIVDGVKASILNPNLQLYQKCFDEFNLPIVFYNNYYRQLPYPHVVTDDRLSSHVLISRLLKAGHRKIAGIFVCDNYQAVEKFHGMYAALLENNIDLDDDYIKWCVSDEAHQERFKKELERFLEELDCTAVICCNSIIYKMLSDIKDKLVRRRSRDLEIVSFDISSSLATSEVICSIHQGFEIGRQAALSLMAMIKNPDFKERLSDYSKLVPPVFSFKPEL